ncbi:MAG: hypothetical protein GXO90_02015 [FCB group bacterium]|nr:hypothetical protein [FCB group bacterium]
MEHQATILVQYEILSGRLPLADLDRRPFTYRQLAAIKLNSSRKFSSVEREALQRYKTEFRLITAPKHLTILRLHPADPAFEPHILTYTDSLLALNIEWREQETVFSTALPTLGRDQVSMVGQLGRRLTLYSQFELHRFGGQSTSPDQMNSYQNQNIQYFTDVDQNIWYQTQSALVYTGTYVQMAAEQIPLIWGPGGELSPLLSGRVAPFPYFRLSIPYGNLRLDYIHGSLGQANGNTLHTLRQKEEKYIAGQRFRWQMTPKTLLSYSEMVIYGNRSPEGAYLNPLAFFWAQEHNLGDRDNLLMALDLIHRTGRRSVWYASLTWDELQWLRMFQPWWGNKFVFQTGWQQAATLLNRPVILSADVSLSRPWTYTHKDSINTYTHLGLPLGFPYGPSAVYISTAAKGWLSVRHFATLKIGYLIKGSGLGTSVNDNYRERDPALDQDTPLILGQEKRGLILEWTGIITINPFLDIRYGYSVNQALMINQAHASLVFSW